MDIARWSIERPLYPWLIIFACIASGWYGINNVGRLEDPVFDFGMALVITPYPGASAVEVEQEVTEVIEAAIQQLPQLKLVTSKSVPGRSEITLEVWPEYMGEPLQQVWDEMRRRVSEAQIRLPPGAGPSIVEDDFGDVYGILYSVTAEGYNAAEIQDIATAMTKRIKRVYGVAKVSTSGLPEEAIYVELDRESLGSLGLPVTQVFNSISVENQVLNTGSVSVRDRRMRILAPPSADSVQAVGNLQIGMAGSTEILRLGDVANVIREPVEVPSHLVRHNGTQTFTLGVSVHTERNVVEVGDSVDQEVAALLSELPIGVQVEPVYRQHQLVKNAIDNFLINLTISIATVIGALCIFMGWRAGAVVGSVLFLTIFGTVGFMSVFGIELQRISLGALMIAMGMLVDNAIVVAEGMVVGTRQGLSQQEAASRSVKRTQYALLGATLIGVLAFAPIGLSDDESGKFLRSLTQVVFISLMLSWVLAITIVPLLGSYLLRPSAEPEALYEGRMYQPYRMLMDFGLRRAWLTACVLAAVTVGGFYAATHVKQGFFPFDSSPLFHANMFLPQGTDINTTVAQAEKIEELALANPDVTDVTSFVGHGGPRITMITRPEQPNPAYAQFLIRLKSLDTIDKTMESFRSQLAEINPDAEFQVYRTSFTPASTSKIEARFSGPDPALLRDLGQQALAAYLKQGLIDRKLDWRQQELTMKPRLNEARAKIAGIDRQHVAQTIAYASTGLQIGLFREDDKLIPVIARAPRSERLALNSWGDRDIYSPVQSARIPASQVIEGVDLVAEDTLVFRRQRARTLTAQANPPAGFNATETHNMIRGDIEAIPLPAGYTLTWGGEYEASQDAQRMLFGTIPLTFGLMLFITILMFGTLRQPLVIWLTVPMSVVGVVVGLNGTGMTFTFPAFLGFLSLSGMLIKNCIILVDETDKRRTEAPLSRELVLEASISRLRPVLLAAGTTIAGMSPLLRDAFFAEMAVAIMAGLAFATILTLIAVPTFYWLAMKSEVGKDTEKIPTLAPMNYTETAFK